MIRILKLWSLEALHLYFRGWFLKDGVVLFQISGVLHCCLLGLAIKTTYLLPLLTNFGRSQVLCGKAVCTTTQTHSEPCFVLGPTQNWQP